jgi:D-glycero-alpha-D-manno-heptose-7-phosphate kinase
MSSDNPKILNSISSTRVDLAGGTLDLWPISTLIKDASTINCSIDCYTSVSFEASSDLKVFVKSPDFSDDFKFESVESFLSADDPKLTLLQEAFSVLEDESVGIGSWILKSDSPSGSGLGGSSSLLISILKIMCQISELKCCDAELIETAKNIESRVLKAPAGIQDYFSPVKKGLNFISYKDGGFVREEMVEALSFVGPCLTIVDSQIKHHSGMNNWEILKKFIDGDQKVKKALDKISETSRNLKIALIKQDFDLVADCFDRELEARKEVSESYLNDELKSFLDGLRELPEVVAYKICGAGGGGCVVILHKPEDKNTLIESLLKKNVSVLPFSLVGS